MFLTYVQTLSQLMMYTHRRFSSKICPNPFVFPQGRPTGHITTFCTSPARRWWSTRRHPERRLPRSSVSWRTSLNGTGTTALLSNSLQTHPWNLLDFSSPGQTSAKAAWPLGEQGKQTCHNLLPTIRNSLYWVKLELQFHICSIWRHTRYALHTILTG